MPAHLILRLEAPLMSFGGDMVDAFGVVRDFPARSMITGLVANALGWDRAEADLHEALQARLVMGSARLREGRRVRDFQTAQLGAADKGWTTRGEPEGRNSTSSTYTENWERYRRTGELVKDVTHIRYRDADADALVLVALRLDPSEDAPDLAAVAAALDAPERPLFIGRKPFLPSTPFVAGHVEADTVLDALRAAIVRYASAPTARYAAQWPIGEGSFGQAHVEEMTDGRNWPAGVHAGLRRAMSGRIGGEAS